MQCRSAIQHGKYYCFNEQNISDKSNILVVKMLKLAQTGMLVLLIFANTLNLATGKDGPCSR